MNPEIISLAKQFHFGVISQNKFTVPEGIEGEDFILALFRAEAKSREERAAADRLKQAKFPAEKKFETFDTDFQKGITAKELEILARLEWLDALYNLILIGPPGTGKTHLALAIGNKAVRELGVRAAFTTMDNLVHILKTQEISVKSQNRLRWFKKCELLRAC